MSDLPAGWHVALRARDLRRRPVTRRIFGVPVTLTRDPFRRPVADAGQETWPTIEQDGLVWVCPRPDGHPPPRMPLYGERGTASILWELEGQSTVGDAAENLLDGTHTPFVHPGLLQNAPSETTVVVRRGERHVEAEYLDDRQTGLVTRLFGQGVDVGFARFFLPGIAQLEYRRGAEPALLVTACFTPADTGVLRAFSVMTGRTRWLPSRLVALLLRPFLWTVLRQDRAILQLQRQNVERFGGEAYRYGEHDVLGREIRDLLAGRSAVASERRVRLWV